MLLGRIRTCMQAALKLNDKETAEIDLDTTPLSVSGWTSLPHLELVLTLERTFGVTFEASEIMEMASVAAIVKTLEERSAG
jgi:acyl carrier protein